MKSNPFVGLSLVLSSLALVAASPSAHAASRRYLVQFADERGARSALQAAGAAVVLELPPQAAVAAVIPEEAVEALRRSPHFALIEPDAERYPLAQSMPYGVALVQAPLVWSQSTGAARKLCLIDSGLSTAHEDLQSSGIDGYPSNWWQDGCGHGTHVGGTLAALDNLVGVVGTLPGGVSLHVVRVFGDNCAWSYVSSLIDALNRCQSAGANVVNMSLGGSTRSWLEERAFARAYRDGLLSVAAAGNNGSSQPSYPASYDSVISVAAIDQNKQVASFSQKNAQVELAAPGVGVLSTVPWGTGYESWSGTSMATPHVSGVAALVWSYNPGWTNEQIRVALQATAEDLGPAGRDSSYGYGLVRARAALDFLTSANAAPSASFGFSCAGLSCSFTDTSTDDTGVVRWSWDFGDGSSSTERNPTHSYTAGGDYTVSLMVWDSSGSTGTQSQTVSASFAAEDPGIVLTARGYKVRSGKRVDLAWSGANPSVTQLDVLRDGVLVATTQNDGAFTDSIGSKGGGVFVYRICEQGSAVCSNQVTVVF